VRRWIHVLVSSVIAFTAAAGAGPAAAVDPSLRSSSPSVFGVGDSLIMQCGRTLGLGTRSTGIIGWGGATSTDLRTRLRSTTENWPYVTEASHAEEVADWKAASTWVIGLGTNDVVRNTPVATFRANVDWFMARAAGRPVLWFNLHSPLHQKRVDTYNIALAAAAKRYPNLVILNWARYAKGHPEALRSDGVHLTDFDACRDGRFALTRAGLPPVEGFDAAEPEWTDPAPVPPPTPNPVTTEYLATGGAAGRLGAATGPLTCRMRGDGCAQFFERGAIAWSPASDAIVMSKAVASAWEAMYADTGRLGYPVAGATCTLVDGGCRQQFQSGYMYEVPGLGARDVMNGPILTEYLSLGAQDGALGYPTTGLNCGLSGTGCYSTFQHGAIFWSHENGAHAINTGFLSRWRANGGRTGPLGNPTSDRICGLRRGGCGQTFEGGGIYWSSATGTRSVVGAVHDRWAAARGVYGSLGYPATDTICGLRSAGCGQNFQGGSVYWSKATGAKVIRGEVRRRWGAARGVYGSLGYPTMDTKCGLVGDGCGQTFSGGSVYWSPATGSRVVKGVIRTRWLAAGGVKSRFGYPVAEQRTITGGWSQRFQHGTLTYRNGRWI
jgi:uncharacterized protein with LGFP repeats